MIDETDLYEAAEETVRQAVEMLAADNCPAGKMPVVLAREIGGVLFTRRAGIRWKRRLLLAMPRFSATGSANRLPVRW